MRSNESGHGEAMLAASERTLKDLLFQIFVWVENGEVHLATWWHSQPIYPGPQIPCHSLAGYLITGSSLFCGRMTKSGQHSRPILGSSKKRDPSLLLKGKESENPLSTMVDLVTAEASRTAKDKVVDCDSDTETDNGGPHPRWVPSAQVNGPRLSNISSIFTLLI